MFCGPSCVIEKYAIMTTISHLNITEPQSHNYLHFSHEAWPLGSTIVGENSIYPVWSDWSELVGSSHSHFMDRFLVVWSSFFSVMKILGPVLGPDQTFNHYTHMSWQNMTCGFLFHSNIFCECYKPDLVYDDNGVIAGGQHT